MIIVLLLLCIGAAVLIPQWLIRRFGFSGLTYTLEFSQPEASEGDTVTLIETICSEKPVPLPWVKAELTAPAALVFASGQSVVSDGSRFVSSFFCLFPYRRIERRWQVRCERRGLFRVEHAVIVLSDLFSSAEISKPFPDACAALTVLPAIRHADALREFPRQLNGDVIRSRAWIPDRYAVSGIREYADGDSVRDICWTATARTGTPMVWQYQETADPTLTVLLNLETRETDISRVSDHAAYENAIRLCAAYFAKASASRIPVRFCANTQIGGRPAESGFVTGESQLVRLLHVLAELPDTITCKFEKLLHRVIAEDSDTAVLIITACVTQPILTAAAYDPRISVISLRPLPSRNAAPNVQYIPAERLNMMQRPDEFRREHKA